MNKLELFLLANQSLQDVVKHVKDEQLDLEIPEDMGWRPNQTLRTALNLYAYENRCVQDVLDGRKDLLTNDEFKEDLLGDDLQGNFAKYHEQAQDAVKNLDDPQKMVHISYGDFPAEQYLSDITVQRGLGAYDLAKFIGADTKLPDELVKGLWEAIVPIADMLRQYNVFKAEIPVPEDAPLMQRLLGLTGRDPKAN
jgi:uncharacterized protein (TIGR03086 family)